MKRIVSILILTILSGCATIADRASDAPIRHPCGNVWDVCPGDSAFLDRINAVLQGHM
ncbi:spanin [Burkholderia phage BcepF1]|uniref:Spanin n=1 Tax=Burkholderia phage BcepF1 TaxID=2886897 RepID=A1YZZ6_9CAUD|nr:spanin [Burkholderia phage BcepF1]ABL96823.1 spanin [Burkholderia phage BcepF1]